MMQTQRASDVLSAAQRVLGELLDGASGDSGLVLNSKDQGLLNSVARLSAAEASRVPAAGGASIAAHVDHLRYGFELWRRWSNGENPFDDTDYAASWERITVSEQEWASRLDALRREARAWHEGMQRRQNVSEEEMTWVIASVAHLGYHLGAIAESIAPPEARQPKAEPQGHSPTSSNFLNPLAEICSPKLV